MHCKGCEQAAPLLARALLLLQKSTVYCIPFNPLEDLLTRGRCVVFKMVLQPNTCKLIIQYLLLPPQILSVGLKIFALWMN